MCGYDDVRWFSLDLANAGLVSALARTVTNEQKTSRLVLAHKVFIEIVHLELCCFVDYFYEC